VVGKVWAKVFAQKENGRGSSLTGKPARNGDPNVAALDTAALRLDGWIAARDVRSSRSRWPLRTRPGDQTARGASVFVLSLADRQVTFHLVRDLAAIRKIGSLLSVADVERAGIGAEGISLEASSPVPPFNTSLPKLPTMKSPPAPPAACRCQARRRARRPRRRRGFPTLAVTKSVPPGRATRPAVELMLTT
jgi:hypothetical protein